MTILDILLNRKSKINNRKSPRLYHYLHENEIEKSRIHLRLDADGHGTLVVNAWRI